ncbi:unnamed protein product [Paramecium octaurelia]|uniref:H-type lectin domain-containing protein n=1 Tax=Paramecium octaurelia TaxID=43137 RepID=A0A8S1T7E2_PAROT|nr:unnamed protein product [Paramecium octaurelia]
MNLEIISLLQNRVKQLNQNIEIHSFMLHLVLISLIQIGLGFMQTRHEVGDIIVMVSGGKHILENSRGYPRQIQTQINFQVEFDISPELFISPHYLDWDLEMPAGFNLKVTLITKTGFLLSTLAGLSPAFTKQGLVGLHFKIKEYQLLHSIQLKKKSFKLVQVKEQLHFQQTINLRMQKMGQFL